MMRLASLLRDRLLLAWLVLCGVTGLSLVIGGGSGAAVGFAVLVIAFSKAGLVMFAFMDLARAPFALRWFATLWLCAALGLLLAVHAGAIG